MFDFTLFFLVSFFFDHEQENILCDKRRLDGARTKIRSVLEAETCADYAAAILVAELWLHHGCHGP